MVQKIVTKTVCEQCAKSPASIFDRPGRAEEMAALQRDIDLRYKHAKEGYERRAAIRLAAEAKDRRTRAGKAAHKLEAGK